MNKRICKNIKLLCIGLLAYWIIGLLFPKGAFAADISLGIYPPILQIQTTPPANIPNPITLQNLSEQEVTVVASIRPFTTSPLLNGQIQFIQESDMQGNDPQILEKIGLFDGDQPVTTFTLAPNQSKNLTLEVDIPQDEPSGDYYFTLLFTSKGIGSDTSNTSSVVGSIGENVLLSIGPTDATTGVLEKFEAPLFLQHGPVPFRILLNNTSKHFITPQGTILIKNMFGQTIGKVNVLGVNILAQSSRYIPSEQPTRYNQSIRGAQDLQQDTNALWDETFLLGLYQANLSIKLSDQGPLFTKSIYFFALPWQGMIILFAIGLVGGYSIYRVRKKLHSSS